MTCGRNGGWWPTFDHGLGVFVCPGRPRTRYRCRRPHSGFARERYNNTCRRPQKSFTLVRQPETRSQRKLSSIDDRRQADSVSVLPRPRAPYLAAAVGVGRASALLTARQYVSQQSTLTVTLDSRMSMIFNTTASYGRDPHKHIQKQMFKDRSVQKIEWKQTADRWTERTDCR